MTLALDIGANTAFFTLVHAVLFKSLPVAKQGELYSLGDSQNGGATPISAFAATIPEPRDLIAHDHCRVGSSL